MTSSFKIGLIGVCVVGAGLGAYAVKHSLKSDRAVKKSGDTSVTAGTTAATGTESPNSAAPIGAGSGPLAMTDNNSGHAASPPPVVPSATGGDSDRSFRPHIPETTAAPYTPPSTAGSGQANTAGSGSQNPFAGSPTPSDSGSGSTITTPPSTTYTPPAPTQTPTPAPMNGERMGLGTATPGGSASGTTGPTTAKSAAPAIPEKTIFHVVQAGDTLSSIAAKYLGSTRYASLIAKANPSVRPNRLMVGAKLKIPAAPAATTQPAAGGGSAVAGAKKPTTAPLPPVDPSKAYTVKRGDGWISLSQQFLGTSNWTILYEYNKERCPSRMLKPGMVIEIPPKETSAPKDTPAPKK